MPKKKQPKLKFGDYYTAEISFFKNNFPHMTIVMVRNDNKENPTFDLLTYEKQHMGINPKNLYYFKLCDKIDMQYKGPNISELQKLIEDKNINSSDT